MEYPDDWKFEENDRVDNNFVLQRTIQFPQESSVRIDIFAGFPDYSPVDLRPKLESYLESMEGEDQHIRSLEVVHMSEVIASEGHAMIWATVSVPTLALAKDSTINQMGEQDENVSQMIDIYILRNGQGQDILVKVYKGTNEDLNLQAEEIVQSIRFINE